MSHVPPALRVIALDLVSVIPPLAYRLTPTLGLSIESLHHDIKGGYQTMQRVKFV